MPTLNDRIRRARTLCGMTQTMLAGKIGVHRSAVAQWESTLGSAPSMQHLIAIALHTGVNLEWLGTGRGQPIAEHAAEEEERAQDVLEVRCLQSLRRMPRRTREQVVALIHIIAP